MPGDHGPSHLEFQENTVPGVSICGAEMTNKSRCKSQKFLEGIMGVRNQCIHQLSLSLLTNIGVSYIIVNQAKDLLYTPKSS